MRNKTHPNAEDLRAMSAWLKSRAAWLRREKADPLKADDGWIDLYVRVAALDGFIDGLEQAATALDIIAEQERSA